VGNQQYWRFPSFFSEASNVDNSSVSSLACGPRVISVANFDETTGQINISSSQGPTRDGRYKPDLAAPGTRIPAARGFTFGEGSPWVEMSGTSMASPYVAGVVGLMLAKAPKLTAAQIGGILQRTSRPLPGVDYQWQDDAGYGKIDPQACLDEVANIYQRKDVTERED
jgi:subtilisin family serine protease